MFWEIFKNVLCNGMNNYCYSGIMYRTLSVELL